jgi:hypothetical protein
MTCLLFDLFRIVEGRGTAVAGAHDDEDVQQLLHHFGNSGMRGIAGMDQIYHLPFWAHMNFWWE